MKLRATREYISTLELSLGKQQKQKNLKETIQNVALDIFLKSAATKKMRLRVWAHSVGEYHYILSRSGLTLRHRMNTINQDYEDLLESGGNNL